MDGESKKVIDEKLERLKELLPEAFTEGKIDWEKLRLTLGDDVNISDVREVWSFVNFITDEIPEYEDSNIDLEKKVDELSKDLEMIKLSLGRK